MRDRARSCAIVGAVNFLGGNCHRHRDDGPPSRRAASIRAGPEARVERLTSEGVSTRIARSSLGRDDAGPRDRSGPGPGRTCGRTPVHEQDLHGCQAVTRSSRPPLVGGGFRPAEVPLEIDVVAVVPFTRYRRGAALSRSVLYVRRKPQRLSRSSKRGSVRNGSHLGSTVRNTRCTSRATQALARCSNTSSRSPKPACTSANA